MVQFIFRKLFTAKLSNKFVFILYITLLLAGCFRKRIFFLLKKEIKLHVVILQTLTILTTFFVLKDICIWWYVRVYDDLLVRCCFCRNFVKERNEKNDFFFLMEWEKVFCLAFVKIFYMQKQNRQENQFHNIYIYII